MIVIQLEKSSDTFSPEFRPNNHLWAYVETKLLEGKVNSKNEVRAALQELWANIPPELTQNLVHSMNNILQTMIEIKGAHKKY